MKNRLSRAWKALKENRGSGVVLVLVAISCITLMTTSLMHLSYTAFKMKAAERQNKVEFYETDAKMDELVAVLQNEMSDAIKEAQKEVLSNYSGDANTTFQEELLSVLAEKLGESNGTCNTNHLSTLLENVRFSEDEHSRYSMQNKKFTLRNIYMTYTSERSGNSTTITTDIIIDANGLSLNSEWDIENRVKLENWKVN